MHPPIISVVVAIVVDVVAVDVDGSAVGTLPLRDDSVGMHK